MDEAENLSSTENLRSSEEDSSGSYSLIHPTKIGRYTILRRLGRGGFGQVFLAFDDDLDRSVAIKVPRPERISQPEDVEAYLNEARILASLDHPHIVPVYDVGRTDDGLCFVVSKFVEGSDLKARIEGDRLSFRASAELVATIAEALHHAHTRGLVHRDIKPANILIDASGKPYVADFGLALKEEDFGRGARLAGTPAYMSPEQARGEGHRVDGRSDIFSLGVVFYELLTGRRPLIAKAEDKDEARDELLSLIATTEPRPPRQIDDTIPKELERICLKALSRRGTDRFTTARDMAEDIREFLKSAGGIVSPVTQVVATSVPPGSTQEETPVPSTSKQSDSDQQPVKIVPKGLRSFDEHDADFFLELLPGPRDRHGLPDIIRFWKTRIEQTDADKTFNVGLIYGPSGCGKSSLVRAGLLPRLAKHVLTVYTEATSDQTATRLLKGLRKACSELPTGLGLVDSLTALRKGRFLRSGNKVLLVVDQFEQWLHSHRGEESTELVAALRQCDGENLQAIVLVRDDFWMAATRLMAELEVELIQGHNTAAVDLFDPRHARKVLMAFGTAYGDVPDRVAEISRDQHAFLDQAITDLAQDGKIVPVRLALFAEMMKGKPWTPVTLRKVGGSQGVGISFLDETFSSPQANPKHRLHQKAAQAVLKTLLPETGADIKGQMRSEHELLESASYAHRPREFAELIHILDKELRLITPTEPADTDDEQPIAPPSGRYFQLTHDYLVHSLRDWLTRKQRQTRRGRAEIRLAEAAYSWGANPRSQNLPTLSEWLSILALTKSDRWTPLQRRMVHAATRRHRAGLLSALFLIGLSCGVPFVGYQYIRATLLLDRYHMAVNEGVSHTIDLIDSMKECRFLVDRLLERKLSDAQKRNDTKWMVRYSAALLPTHPDKQTYLYSVFLPEKHITQYSTYYHPSYENQIANKVLSMYDPAYTSRLWEIVTDNRREIWKRYFAASKLAKLDPLNEKWEEIMSDIIAHHNFANDPLLSFSQASEEGTPSKMSAQIKDYIKKPLFKKIDQCSESNCPVFLLWDILTPREALTVIAEGYLNGHFSWQGLKEIEGWIGHITRSGLVDFREFFRKETTDSERERRRQCALLWLKDRRWLWGKDTQ